MTDTRAQTEVIGNILLVATIVIAVSVAGAAYLATIGGDEETLADVDATTHATGTPQVAFTHQGGDPVDNDSLVFRVWVAGSPASWSFNGSASSGDGDGRFQAGDRWVYDVPAMTDGDVVRALLATNSTNTVLVDERTTFEG